MWQTFINNIVICARTSGVYAVWGLDYKKPSSKRACNAKGFNVVNDGVRFKLDRFSTWHEPPAHPTAHATRTNMRLESRTVSWGGS